MHWENNGADFVAIDEAIRVRFTLSESENINHAPRDRSFDQTNQFTNGFPFNIRRNKKKIQFEIACLCTHIQRNERKLMSSFFPLIQFQAEVTKNQSQEKRKYML